MKTGTALIALGLCLPFSGCLTVSEDGEPTLSVEIYWDDDPSEDDFRGEDCYGAGVERMDWALWRGSDRPCSSADEADGECRDGDGNVRSFELFAEDEDNCLNALDLIDAPPGTYELDITGYDAAQNVAWSATCTDLRVLRFDIAYACDVYSL